MRRVGGWTKRLEAFERALAHARRAGHVPPGSLGLTRRLSLLRHDSRVGTAGVARRERATSRAGPVPECLPGRGAGDARPLRRGARDPRRDASGAGGARRGSPAREHHRLRVRRRRAPGRRSRRRGRVRQQKGSGCTRSWGNELPVGRGREPRAGALRARSARRGGSLGRPRRGARRERRHRRRRCSGGRSRPRCSRVVASTPRRSGSRARRSRWAMSTEYLNGQGRRERRSRGGAPARRRARRSGRRAGDGGGALRSQGQPRLGAARAGAARRAPATRPRVERRA